MNRGRADPVPVDDEEAAAVSGACGKRDITGRAARMPVEPATAGVPVKGAAEEVSVGGLPALWIGGTARGTFTLIGADGGVHRESFDVGSGVLLWKDDEMTFLLQGAGSTADAMSLAGSVDG